MSDPAEPALRSSSDGAAVTVFISYSHDSAEHEQRVLELAQRLRRDGVDCTIDRFVNGSPPEGWPLWMERGIAAADFVLVVCSEVYRRRHEGREAPTKGRGATWESILSRQELYEGGANSTKFVPIMFDGASEGDVPKPLRAYTHYRMEGAYDDLLRHITNQPAVVPSTIGPLRRLPPVHGPLVETHASPSVADPWELRIAAAREIHSPLLREALIWAATAGMNGDLGITTTVLAGSFDALRIHVQREYRRARGSDAPALERYLPVRPSAAAAAVFGNYPALTQEPVLAEDRHGEAALGALGCSVTDLGLFQRLVSIVTDGSGSRASAARPTDADLLRAHKVLVERIRHLEQVDPLLISTFPLPCTPVPGAFVLRLYALLDSEDRQRLGPLVKRLLEVPSTPATEHRRLLELVDSVVREIVPMRLDADGNSDTAVRLRQLADLRKLRYDLVAVGVGAIGADRLAEPYVTAAYEAARAAASVFPASGGTERFMAVTAGNAEVAVVLAAECAAACAAGRPDILRAVVAAFERAISLDSLPDGDRPRLHGVDPGRLVRSAAAVDEHRVATDRAAATVVQTRVPEEVVSSSAAVVVAPASAGAASAAAGTATAMAGEPQVPVGAARPAPLPAPPAAGLAEYRFEVALSFAGDNKRDKVRAVAEILRAELGDGRVFFDEWYEAELAGHDAHVVLQKIYGKQTFVVVVGVCNSYQDKPWTQEEWRAIQAFERGLRDASTDNRRRMRLLPLRFGDGEVDGLFDTALVPDVRGLEPLAIAKRIRDRVREARGETRRQSTQPPAIVAATRSVTQVEGTARAGDGSRAGAASRSRATGPGRRAGSEPPPGDASERVRRAQRTIEATLAKHPQLCKRLAERADKRPEEVAGALIAMRGSEMADLGAELYLELRPKPDAAADALALESVIFTALPCAADLRDLVAHCPVTGKRDCDVIELNYRSRAIAEAVVAGWVGRACLFVENSGTEPQGRGALRAPATTHAPVFMPEEQLRKDVVADFARRFRIERSNPRDLATAVNDWLDHRAVNDRRANDAMLRENAGVHGLHPVRYYYLFRDSDVAEEQERDGWWELVQRALHPREGGGLSRLVLVRMTGGEDSEQNRLDYALGEITNKPQDARDKPPTS